jgi:NEDD8-activating enzyme E1
VTPRLPEHCITYASMFEWPNAFPDRALDTDSPNDVQWIYHTALKRAEKFGILGVTYFLTLGTGSSVV